MKLLITCTTLILLASNVELQNEGCRCKIDVSAIFKEAGFADINFTIPTAAFQVTLSGNTTVNLGNNIFVGDTTELTSIGGFYVSPDCYYTMMAFDVDLPKINDTYLSPFLLGMYMNIRNLDLQSGDVVAQYIPAGPIPANGDIRVLFYLFLQQQKLDVSCESIANYRTNRIAFPLEEFVEENGLCLEAGNFFYTAYPVNLQEVCQDTCVQYCESCLE